MTPSQRPEDRVVTPRDWVGFLAMVLGMFMAILDIQIVASSIAQIQAGISASAEEISWVQTSYLIAEVVMIPLSGWLAWAISFSNVDLPAPLTPMTHQRSLRRMVMSRPS